MKTVEDYKKWIGKKVSKIKDRKEREPKPFTSGFKVNTVKDVIDHPILHVPAFIFHEDASYVACVTCKAVLPVTVKR